MRFWIIFVFAFFNLLVCLSGVSEVINVPDRFRTIGQAVVSAKKGDIILVAPGEYRENIEIKKGLCLQGAGADLTTIIGSITVEDADGAKVDGFKLEGSGRDSHFGIWCVASSLIISNNAITGYHHGIGATSFSMLVIESNSVFRNFVVGI